MAAEIPGNGVAYFFSRYTRAHKRGGGGGGSGDGKSGKKR